MLNISPKDLLRQARARPSGLRRRPDRYRMRRTPPSWRTCRVDMSRAQYLRVVAGWSGAVAILLVIVLSVRWL